MYTLIHVWINFTREAGRHTEQIFPRGQYKLHASLSGGKSVMRNLPSPCMDQAALVKALVRWETCAKLSDLLPQQTDAQMSVVLHASNPAMAVFVDSTHTAKLQTVGPVCFHCSSSVLRCVTSARVCVGGTRTGCGWGGGGGGGGEVRGWGCGFFFSTVVLFVTLVTQSADYWSVMCCVFFSIVASKRGSWINIPLRVHACVPQYQQSQCQHVIARSTYGRIPKTETEGET